MAVERKMEVKSRLDFGPGQQATTPLGAVVPEKTPIEHADKAPSQDTVEVSLEQTEPSLKGVVVYLAQAEAIALKVYAAQHSTSIQQLGTEAFSELFRKLGINGGVLTRTRANRKNGANR